MKMKAQVFQHHEVLSQIKTHYKDEEVTNLVDWLSNAPNNTTFRVNRLRNFGSARLETHLRVQSAQLKSKEIPKYYFLRPDCLILEQWPADVKFEKTGKEVIVDAACAAAVLRGAHVYAPGVMGLAINCEIDDIVDIYGDMEAKCRKGLKVKYNGDKKFIGTGQLKMLRNQLFGEDLKPSGIAVHTILPISRLPVVNETLYSKGDILLQNLPSIVCGWVLDAKPNDHILDMCAAPGNKTTHLAEMAKDQAFIIALDKSIRKVEKIDENTLAHGITCVKSFAFDSTKCYSPNSKGIYNGPPFPENSFDKILLDAPCSGLGQRPQLLNSITPKMLSSYKHVQRKLMEAAFKLLKVGGKLVYSTCTITEDENEGMVVWALKQFPCLNLIPAEPLIGGPGWSDCGLTDKQRSMVQRFGPENDPLRPVTKINRDTIGFFIATFTKVEIY